jgi:hypothetical protein
MGLLQPRHPTPNTLQPPAVRAPQGTLKARTIAAWAAGPGKDQDILRAESPTHRDHRSQKKRQVILTTVALSCHRSSQTIADAFQLPRPLVNRSPFGAGKGRPSGLPPSPQSPNHPERGPLAGPRRRTRSVHPPQKPKGAPTPSATHHERSSRRPNIFLPLDSANHPLNQAVRARNIPVQAAGLGKGSAESPTHRHHRSPEKGQVSLTTVALSCRRSSQTMSSPRAPLDRSPSEAGKGRPSGLP